MRRFPVGKFILLVAIVHTSKVFLPLGFLFLVASGLTIIESLFYASFCAFWIEGYHLHKMRTDARYRENFGKVKHRLKEIFNHA